MDVSFNQPGSNIICSLDNLTACGNENDCTLAGGYWYNSQCNSTPQPNIYATSITIGGVTDNNLSNGIGIVNAHIDNKTFLVSVEINNSAKNKSFNITATFHIKDLNSYREYTATLNGCSMNIDVNGNITANISTNATLSITGKDSNNSSVSATLTNLAADTITFNNNTLTYDISKIEAKLQSIANSSLHKVFYDNSVYNVSFAINGLPGFSTISGSVSFGTPQSQCSATNLSSCTNQIDCENVSGYWYNNQCNSFPANNKKWEYKIDGSIYSTPAIASDGTIYVSSINKNLYALNPDGTLKWTFGTGGYLDASPVIASDGTIYIGSHDRKLYAINPDGAEKWHFNAGGSISSTLAIASDGTIYVGITNGKLYALYDNGSVKWKLVLGGEIKSSPAIGSDGTIYVGSNDNKLYALYDNGSLKWTFNTGDDITSSPVVGNNVIYIGSGNGKLFALNLDGSEKWVFQTGGYIYSTPAINDDGTVYFASKDKKVYALNSDGTQKWTFTSRDYIYSSPAIGSDGTIYIGSNDHRIYAFYGSSSLSTTAPWAKFHKDSYNSGR